MSSNAVITLPPGPASIPPARYGSSDVIADKYQLMSVIGTGGMGAVWTARNLTLHVDVALKLIHRDAASKEAAARLLQEARAAAQLQHPAIVRVHDFGETSHGDPFIVMERLEGESLGALLARRASLPASNAVQMLLPIIGGLAVAHEKGIVHRDLKPENIILVGGRGGVVKPTLVDFGIAKMRFAPAVPEQQGHGAVTLPSVASRLTQQGRLVGTVHYMSPEQARGGGDVDERADVWGMSVLLYETVAGRRPFEHPGAEELLQAILCDEPPPVTACGVGDAKLAAILERGLRKKRGERWQSMNEMGAALARWLVDQGVRTDVAGSSLEAHWLSEHAEGPLDGAASQHQEGAGEISDAGRSQRLLIETREADAPAANGATRYAADTIEAPLAVVDDHSGAVPSAPPPAWHRDKRSRLMATLLASVVLVNVAVWLSLPNDPQVAETLLRPAVEAARTVAESAAARNAKAVEAPRAQAQPPPSVTAPATNSIPKPTVRRRRVAPKSPPKRTPKAPSFGGRTVKPPKF